MTVGFFSPLPPARTGVADYSAALLRALREFGEVKTNPNSADVNLYHLGNNSLHGEIHRRALQRPGVAVIHDAVLHHFYLGSLGKAEYVREFAFNYGEWAAGFAEELWRERARSATDPRYFRYPMLKRVVEASLGVIVHNPAAAAMVRAHVPEARVFEIPHLFELRELPAPYETERLRAELGCSGQTLLCGVFGHLRESKRIFTVIRAVQRARSGRDVRLLIAGEFASRDLARALEPELSRPGVIRVGYLPDEGFWRYAAAVDVCANLRYPAAGETSGIAIRLMGLGKPVILTDGLETSRFPQSACLRADSGESEEEALLAHLLWLADARGDRLAIGSRASEYIRKEHGLSHVAQEYWRVLGSCYHKN